jgi:hypothetical protein
MKYLVLAVALLTFGLGKSFVRTHRTSVRANRRKEVSSIGVLWDSDGKWSVPVLDEGLERIESVKAGAAGSIAGVVGSIVPVVALGFRYGFNNDWLFHLETGVILYSLFGIVYRYAVRRDTNPSLKQGVVGAFAITQTLSSLSAPDGINMGLVIIGGVYLLANAFPYASAAYAIESCFAQGLISPFPRREF